MSVVYADKSTAATSSNTSLTWSLQARSNGDLLVAGVAVLSNAVISTPSGWTKLNQTNAGATFTVAVYWRITNNAEADPVFTWTGAVEADYVIYRFRGSKSIPIGAVGTAGSGTVNPHTASGVTTTAPDSFVIIIDFANSSTGGTAHPTPWVLEEAVDMLHLTTILSSQRIAASGGSSGAVSYTSVAAPWVQQQIELLNQPIVPGTRVRKYLRR